MVSLWRASRRSITTIDDYIQAFQYGGNTYVAPTMGPTQTMPGVAKERLPADFVGYAVQAATNSVLFACLSVRQDVFSSVRFQWQRLTNGSPSELFGTRELALLEEPWTGGTTQDLLARMIQDADLAGNSYWTVQADQLVRLRPDWVDIVAEPIMLRGGRLGWRRLGYIYSEPDGDPVVLLADEVAHFAPKPDPLASFRGMSWMTPLAREARNDNLMSAHKEALFENRATPNVIVSFDREVKPDSLAKFQARMDAEHRGPRNAGKTMYVGGGADVTVVGSNMQELDFTRVQGAGETRIAAAAGVPPVIVGLSEGLAAATYSNYSQARRRFADGTMHPLWANAAGSLARIVRTTGPVASGAVRLWYDARGVPFLREDRKDAAEIQGRQAQTIRTLVDAGYTPDSVQRAVDAEDWSLLTHTGLFSVQLQPPGAGQASDPAVRALAMALATRLQLPAPAPDASSSQE
ncbi:phage portal protein [Streptomyces caeni]|uniref:Phage portal protein n=1 Tax=Streptomyces caeni TaxID=2307231 RepID=A0ABW4IJC3_9ACTN